MQTTQHRTPHRGTLLFLHVPRSGGRTLHRIIYRQYPASSIYLIDGLNPQQSIEHFTNLPPSRLEQLRCVMGHMRFGLHSDLPQAHAYLTLLRDPVDRLVSHYHYVLRRTDHYLHTRVAHRSMTLEEHVASGLSPELTNWQTRAIAGIPEDENAPSHSALLERARRNLDTHFVMAGITDLFDESLILMRRRWGWGHVYYAKRNVIADRPTPSEIPDGTVRLIRELNEADLKLCSLVRRRLAESIEAEGPSFHEELRRSRRLNRIYSTIWLPYEKLRMHPGARSMRSMLVGALGLQRG